jgi:hypothetical protein
LQSTIGEALILAEPQQNTNEPHSCFMIKTEMNLYISSFREVIGEQRKEPVTLLS